MDAYDIIEWLRTLPDWGIYAFLCISSMLENLFPPWPGDVFIVFAGFLSAHEVLTLPASFIASLIGNILSGLIMYYAGTYVVGLVYGIRRRLRRPRFIRRWLGDVFSKKELEKTRVWFRRRGAWLVVISRFLAGIRIFVVVVAGLSRMNMAIFLLSFSVAVSIWNVLLLGGGYALGENWELVVHWVKLYSQVAVSVISVAVLIWLFVRYRKRNLGKH